ncbi:MAG: hypothetical protein HY791_33955 [Deltaproteobacteria bacterium]|nr:hypothetical protein [Deltaproteobacteria bacterium]
MTLIAPLLKTAHAATELNSQAPILGLSKDGLKFEGLDGLEPARRPDGSVDRLETAKAQGKLALGYLTIAATPDKALIGSALAFATAEDSGAFRKVLGPLLGASLGLIGDVVEAVPAAILAVTYGVSAGVNTLRS